MSQLAFCKKMYKTTHVLKPSSEIEFKGIYINFLITVMEI